MYIPISKTSPKPAYQQIVETIRRRILTGELKPEQELPSIRQLAQDSQVSVITIRRAYSDLEGEGLIYSRAGLGSYVAQLNPKMLEEYKMDLILPLMEELAQIIKTLQLDPRQAEELFSNLLKKETGNA